MYFLLVFSDNVEDFLHPLRYVWRQKPFITAGGSLETSTHHGCHYSKTVCHLQFAA